MDAFKMITFKLGGEEYGLNIEHVLSIEKIQHITRVPNVPPFVRGVMNLRGNVLPVIDTREKLELGLTTLTDSTRVIVTRLNDVDLGFIVEQTGNVMDINPEAVESAKTAGFTNRYFDSIYKSGGSFIILLNLEELSAGENLEAQLTE